MNKQRRIKILSGILAGVLVISLAGYKAVLKLKDNSYELQTDRESYSSSIIIDTSPAIPGESDKYPDFETSDQETITVDPYSGVNKEDYKEKVEELFSYMNNNPNLSNQEKDMFRKFIPLLNKYRRYLQYDELKQKLQTIDIKYGGEVSFDNTGINSPISEYNPNKNVIIIYFANSFEDYQSIPGHLKALEHEMLHALSCTKTNEDNFAFEEGVTRILQEEVFPAEFGPNIKEVCYFNQMLCELVGKEKMMEAYFNHADFSIIEKELLKLDDDKTKLKEFSDNFVNFFYQIDNSLDDEEYSDFTKIILNKLLETYNHYYEIKNGIDSSNDMYISKYIEYLNKRMSPTNYYNCSLIDKITVGYFYDKYIEDHKDMEISYKDYDSNSISTERKITILEENRYNNSKIK